MSNEKETRVYKPGERLREIRRAADKEAGAYFLHSAVEDSLHISGKLQPGDYFVGLDTENDRTIAKCVRTNGDPVDIPLDEAKPNPG